MPACGPYGLFRNIWKRHDLVSSRIYVRIFWRYGGASGLSVQYGANSVVPPAPSSSEGRRGDLLQSKGEIIMPAIRIFDPQSRQLNR